MITGHPDLIADILAEMTRTGPIPFARFMELALYHPQFGYYMRPPEPGTERIGWNGDFYTSSDVHPFLGEALAKQARQVDTILGCPHSFTVVEMGAGKGFLARDFLTACRSLDESFASRVRYVLIERSPAMQSVQQQVLTSWTEEPGTVTWLASLDEFPSESLIGLFLSNELVDAFPVHRIACVKGQLREIYVEQVDGGLRDTYGPLSTPDLARLLDQLGLALRESQQADINLDAVRWMRKVGQVMARGIVVTIDYGHTAQDLYAPERGRGTLLCYYHQTASEDPYSRVGEQDMTAHVDFSSLAAAGAESGLNITGFTNQMSFLIGLGVEQMLDSLPPDSPEFSAAIQLLRPDGMGRTFKVLIQHKGMARPQLDGLTFQPFFGTALVASGEDPFVNSQAPNDRHGLYGTRRASTVIRGDKSLFSRFADDE